MHHVRSELVAFVDSDVILTDGCLQRLAAYFADPGTAVVGPRVAAAEHGPGVIASYEAAHSTLDMGTRPGRVMARCPVPYLASATLVARREALGAGFDETMRVGEDVDLVWRVTDAGWAVWYDPSVTVLHAHRLSPQAFISRRFAYATSIGLLAARHPDSTPALHVSPSTGVLLLAVARRPWLACGLAGILILRMRAALAPRCDQPLQLATELMARSFASTARGGAYAARRPWLPVVLLASRRSSQARRVLGAALLFRVMDTRQTRPSHVVVAVVEDAVAAAGTWWSCVRYKTLGPLRPIWQRRRSLSDRFRAQAGNAVGDAS
jgi:mycofactocin system glycosyltransferase